MAYQVNWYYLNTKNNALFNEVILTRSVYTRGDGNLSLFKSA